MLWSLPPGCHEHVDHPRVHKQHPAPPPHSHAHGRGARPVQGTHKHNTPAQHHINITPPLPPPQVLNVSRDANADQIRAAWKRLAKEHHPDKHAKANSQAATEAAELFKQIAFAYSVLSDPEKRRRYDMYGPEDLDLEDFDEFAAQVDPNGVGPIQKAMLSLLNKTGLWVWV